MCITCFGVIPGCSSRPVVSDSLAQYLISCMVNGVTELGALEGRFCGNVVYKNAHGVGGWVSN